MTTTTTTPGSAAARAETARKAAESILEQAKAAGRDLDPTEQATVAEHIAEAQRMGDLASRQAKGAALVESIGGMAPDEQHTTTAGAPVMPRPGKSRVLALTGAAAKAHAAGIATASLARGGYGTKAAIESGSVVTQTPLQDGVVGLGRTPHSLLELLPVTVRSSPTYRYLRQTVRTNNAAIVAPGATKPTSVYTVKEEDGKLQVFAHISEPLDKYLLVDAAELERFISSEMLYGLHQAVETEVLSGDGTTGHLKGILNTSGIQTQAAGDDPVTTLRAAVTKLESAGYVASAFVLTPSDWEAIESARNASGNFDLNGPVDRASQKVWGVPVVLSNGLAPGTALALDIGAATVSVDVGIETKWSDQHSDLFAKNQIVARVEGRFGIDVVAPNAIVEVTLTDDDGED